MGQKVNPIGFRLGVNRDWRSRWYASPQEMPAFLQGDLEIRNYVKKKLQFAAVAKIIIERAWNSIRVTIHTARPGIVIGRKGAEIEKMTEEISRMAQGKQIKIDIQEIKTPELDAQLVAENVALQIERRIAYRRAMKKSGANRDGFWRTRDSLAQLGPVERCRNFPFGVVSRRKGTASYPAYADRLRLRRSEYGLRQDWSEMLDL
jgi:ribosomal protein S3